MKDPKGTVLVVDDEPAIRALASRYLQDMGFQCIAAAGAQEALRVLSGSEIDLVLTDIKMPGMSGMDLLARVVSEHPDTCVVMATAVADFRTAVEAMKTGAADYVVKPIDLEDLGIRVERAIERQRLAAENREYRLRLAEQALNESEERFRDLFENANDLIQSVDADGRFIYVNRKWKETLGYSDGDIDGIGLADVLRSDQIPHCMGLLHELLKSSSVDRVKTVFVGKDGREVYVEGNVNARIEDGALVTTRGIFRDVTERKQAENALRDSEERFRALARSTPDGIVTTDGTGIIVFWNPAAERIFGYSGEEALGRPLSAVMPGRHADRHEEGLASAKLAGNGSSVGNTVELTGMRRDGTEVPIEVSIATWSTAGDVFFSAIVRDITDRKLMDEQQRGLLAAQEEQNRILVKAHLDLEKALDDIRRSEEELRKYQEQLEEVVTQRTSQLRQTNERLEREVDKRRRAQRRTMGTNQKLRAAMQDLRTSQEQLLQSAKLAAVGELVSGVAHEINNPLAAISLYSELLLDETMEESVLQRIEAIHGQADRTVGIVENLLSFARKHEPKKTRVSVNDVLDSVLKLREYELNLDNIIVSKDLDADLPVTMADFRQLQQVFLNLVTNAEQAMGEAHGRGKLLVRTEVVGGNIRITISDDGPGMPEEHRSRVFEPFFTTKDVGKGTGLGLSICHGIIQEHDGRISVETALGVGTTFIIDLPIVVVSEGGDTPSDCVGDPRAAAKAR